LIDSILAKNAKEPILTPPLIAKNCGSYHLSLTGRAKHMDANPMPTICKTYFKHTGAQMLFGSYMMYARSG